MYWLVLIIISLIMAFLLKTIFKSKELNDYYWTWLVVSFVGTWVGDLVLGDWWWLLGEFNVVAGIIGSLVIGWIYTLIFSNMSQSEDLNS